MLIVGLDTAGKDGSIALGDADGESYVQLGEATLANRMFSAEILPQLIALLATANRKKTDIDAFAVVCGPGSFTGLRVGIATVKALADVWSKPVAAVSMLELIAATDLQAAPLASQGEVTVVMDAGRGDLFAATFAPGDPVHRIGDEMLMKLREFLEAACPANSALPARRILTPDESVAARLREAGLTVEVATRPAAREVAAYGARMIQRGEITDAASLDANYVRRADAELYGTPKV